MLQLLARLIQIPKNCDCTIPWSSPILTFGRIDLSLIATLGINPSNREFVDIRGNELLEENRRFHTLKSLKIEAWSEIRPELSKRIIDSNLNYFETNPYNGWFRALDHIICGTGCSYYSDLFPACHLDLIPFSTKNKWHKLSNKQKKELLTKSDDTLGVLLKESKIRTIILNGEKVVRTLEDISDQHFSKVEMPTWALPRSSAKDLPGFAYEGFISKVSGVELGRKVTILGFNHNMQSSHGMTNFVKTEIRDWISSNYERSI